MLSVKSLAVSFQTRRGEVEAVRGISFELAKGEILGIVGESGSGKSVTSYALMRILDAGGTIKAGEATYSGIDLRRAAERDMRDIRGREISMIFQNPRAALNPIHDAIGREANELKKLSDRYRKADTPERRQEAKALERAAFILSSGGTLDHAPQMTVRERSEAKRNEEQQEKIKEKAVEPKWENPSATLDASTDRSSRARVDQNDRAHQGLEGSRAPNRRLTELELRELLNEKEREHTEQRGHEEEKRQLRLRNADPKEPYNQTNDTDSSNERESANTAGRDFDEARSRGSERKKPPTEQELSDILSQGVRKLNDAEKRRQRSGADRRSDRGLEFD